ncbi:MAG TPA: hypothetical protein GX406_07570 [Pseudoclavibacter sp.]|nr:hypothetical protein [Pseudoclavibacter sp.]
MTNRQRRLVRGGAIATVATFTALASHALAGGMIPHPGFVFFAWSISLAIGFICVGDRQVSLGRTAGIVLPAQAVFHVFFEWMGMPEATAVGVVSRGHQHGIASSVGIDVENLIPAVAPSPGMIVAHVIAAVVTCALLYRGMCLVRWLSTLVMRAVRTSSLVLIGFELRLREAPAVDAWSSQWMRPHLGSRGPPSLSRW